VDSSVGGKTGVNLPEGKNLLGAFHQPSLVVADVATLQTLPEREFRSGLAELTKHAMIADAELFGLLEEGAEKVARRDPDTLKRLVARSIAIKAGVVESDEREGGRRAILNFGHTVGHALEAAAGYGRITHGQAVAVGMLAATILSVRRGLCPRKDLDRFRALLDRLGLLQELPVNLQSFDNYIVSDKKMRDGVLQFVLTPGVGSVTLAPVSDLEEVRAALVDLAQYLRSRE
ncbi:MAG: 3-dehydroquinate synthase family protein, partial [Candidatus Methylomirabilota bacterium]